MNSNLPVGAPPKPLQPLPLSAVRPAGELRLRLDANLDRLEQERYWPAQVFVSEEKAGGWSGDVEGRIILGLTLDAQATGRDPATLAEIVRQLPERANERGYFGTLHAPGTAAEQQLSGHGWLLRGLCEYLAWTADEDVRRFLERVVENLVLPTAGLHAHYPIEPDLRPAPGTLTDWYQKWVGAWLVSSDTGCDFIFMDGVIHAYASLADERLRPVIDEMVARFLEVDQEAMKAQTHATLTALRGLLRYFELCGDARLLEAVEQRYRRYRGVAMTENYENWNWYGKPELTEPCAVIDSFMVATSLWRHTGRTEYLEDAHLIYYNGICVEQRSNGGFGCHTCTGARDNREIGIVLDEAHWCCTMRGGEGLPRVAQHLAVVGPDAVYLPLFFDGEILIETAGGRLLLRERSAYPFEGHVRLEVAEVTGAVPSTLRLFAPSWSSGHRLSLNGEALPASVEDSFVSIARPWARGDVIEFAFDLTLRTVAATHMPGHLTALCGPLVLCYDGDPLPPGALATLKRAPDGALAARGVTLRPLHHVMDPQVWLANGWHRQVVF